MAKKKNETPDSKKKLSKKEKAQSKPKKIARTAQEIIDFEAITSDGIVKTTGKNGKPVFSKLYKLTDGNFITEPQDNQEDLLGSYSMLMNRFPENVDITIAIVNEKITQEQLSNAYHVQYLGDDYDSYREEYNKIIDNKIKEGHSDIQKTKYIMLSVHADDLSTAESEYSAYDISLREAVSQINKSKKPLNQLNAFERLTLMSKILKGSEEHKIPFGKEYGRYFDESGDKMELNVANLRKDGVSVKDLIAPQIIKKQHGLIELDEDRYCRSYSLANLPAQLDTSFLTKITNIPHEIITVLQFNPVPSQKAKRLVKMQNTSIKADVIKASKEAYKNGYDPSLINEDLQQAQVEAQQLRQDIVADGKKLFFATITSSIFAKDEEELENVTKQFVAKCADYSLTPKKLLGEQIQGLNASLLLGSAKIINDRMLTSENVQAFFPFHIQEINDRTGHYYGNNAISKNLIMYDRKRSKLANGMIFGMSGSGKSFITKGEIIPNLLDGKDDMIILDPENEYHVVAEAFGGVTINLKKKSDVHINPCDLSMEWNEDEASPVDEKCDYMVGLVESILGKNRECNIYQINVIHSATHKMYEDYVAEMTRRHEGDCPEGKSDEFDPEICPTLYDFYKELLQIASEGDGSAEAHQIALAIEQYATPHGTYNLFSHHTNIDWTNKRLVVFNLLSLPDKMMEMAMKVCLSTIWNRVVKNREENEKYHTGKSIWVYLDEFHHFFRTESCAETVKAYFKRVRKYGGIMTGITQDISDLLNSQAGTAMFTNTGFFILLNQSVIGQNMIRELWSVPDALVDFINNKPVGSGLIYNNEVIVPIDYKLPKGNSIYTVMTTNPNDLAQKQAIKQKANEEMEALENEFNFNVMQ